MQCACQLAARAEAHSAINWIKCQLFMVTRTSHDFQRGKRNQNNGNPPYRVDEPTPNMIGDHLVSSITAESPTRDVSLGEQ